MGESKSLNGGWQGNGKGQGIARSDFAKKHYDRTRAFRMAYKHYYE